jgi:hypothetical protein
MISSSWNGKHKISPACRSLSANCEQRQPVSGDAPPSRVTGPRESSVLQHILEGAKHPRVVPPPSTPRLPARKPDGRHINYLVTTRFPLNPTCLLSLCGSLYRANPFTYEATIGFSLPPSIRLVIVQMWSLWQI